MDTIFVYPKSFTTFAKTLLRFADLKRLKQAKKATYRLRYKKTEKGLYELESFFLCLFGYITVMYYLCVNQKFKKMTNKLYAQILFSFYQASKKDRLKYRELLDLLLKSRPSNQEILEQSDIARKVHKLELLTLDYFSFRGEVKHYNNTIYATFQYGQFFFVFYDAYVIGSFMLETGVEGSLLDIQKYAHRQPKPLYQMYLQKERMRKEAEKKAHKELTRAKRKEALLHKSTAQNIAKTTYNAFKYKHTTIDCYIDELKQIAKIHTGRPFAPVNVLIDGNVITIEIGTGSKKETLIGQRKDEYDRFLQRIENANIFKQIFKKQ